MTDDNQPHGLPGERIVGGLSCAQVLARLGDYLDGGLPGQERAQIETHVRGCGGCENFGGTFAAAVKTLKARLAEATDLPDDVAARLWDRLSRL